VIVTADEARESDRLRSLIARTAATAMQGTPQTWRLLTESAGGVPAGLRLRLCGGENLPADLGGPADGARCRPVEPLRPDRDHVWSRPGSSPARHRRPRSGRRSSTPRVRPGRAPDAGARSGGGRGLPAGRGVARGYHCQPRLTARSFRPDPWSDEPGARMYRTGDLGRWGGKAAALS